MISANLSAIFYLVSGVLFILALRGLSSPETSRRGNMFGIIGMVIAITKQKRARNNNNASKVSNISFSSATKTTLTIDHTKAIRKILR